MKAIQALKENNKKGGASNSNIVEIEEPNEEDEIRPAQRSGEEKATRNKNDEKDC